MMKPRGPIRSQPRTRRRTSIRRLVVERLEVRLPKYGADLEFENSADLTISFVPDGTNVSGQPSQLFAKLDQVAPTEVWQDAVVDAFETWTDLIDGKVRVVDDQGQELGAEGESKGDPRFGDVRIAAVPMSSEVIAIAVPRSAPVGTWAGDIVFNTEADLRNTNELIAVTLHEAGHVLGLDHSADPNSPMYESGIPEGELPTPADIRELRQIYEQIGDEDRPEGEHNGSGWNHHPHQSDSGNGQGQGQPVHYDEHDHEHDHEPNVLESAFIDHEHSPAVASSDSALINSLILESFNAQNTSSVRSFHVSQPDIVQFSLATASEKVQNNAVISATIRNADGQLVSQVETRAGEAAQATAVLLLPGEYSVELKAECQPGTSLLETTAVFYGNGQSDPLSPGVSDPTYDPMYPAPSSYYSNELTLVPEPIIYPSLTSFYQPWPYYKVMWP